MNGRIYDPLLGRMLQGDVWVQFPGNLQSFNRYSYVRNNPLTVTDPTGYAEGDDDTVVLPEMEISAKRLKSSGRYKDGESIRVTNPKVGNLVRDGGRAFILLHDTDSNSIVAKQLSLSPQAPPTANVGAPKIAPPEIDMPELNLDDPATISADAAGEAAADADSALDKLQFALDGIGLIPGAGEVADGLSAIISLARGDFVGAGLSAMAMLPIGGQAATAANMARKGGRLAKKAATAAEKSVGHHTITRAAQKRLPPKVKSHPDVRGRPGKRNIKDIPESTHRRIHSSAPGEYYPGGHYSRREHEMIMDRGGYDVMTPEQMNEIREELLEEFGL